MSKVNWKIEKAIHADGLEMNSWYCFYCIIDGKKKYALTNEPIFLHGGLNKTMNEIIGDNRFTVCFYNIAQTAAKLLNGKELTDKQKENVEALINEYQIYKIREKYNATPALFTDEDLQEYKETTDNTTNDIESLNHLFSVFRDKLCEDYHNGNFARYNKYINDFDWLMKDDAAFHNLAIKFDIPSDLEAAAFMIAYERFNGGIYETPQDNICTPEETEAAAIINSLENENKRIDNFPAAAKALGLTVKTKGETTNDPIIWITGDTKPHKDWLKAQGARWCAKKVAWYFHPNRVRSRAAA